MCRRLPLMHFVSLLCLAASQGCAGHSTSGVTYTIPALPATTERERIPVTFVDSRPEWERDYYDGGDDPDLPRFAVKFFPHEQFAPAVPELLTQSIRYHGGKCADPPQRAELELRSFRVVANQAQQLETQAREQKQADEERRRQRDHRRRSRQLQRESEYNELAAAAERSGQPLPPRPTTGDLADSHCDPDRSLEPKSTSAPYPPAELPESYAENITCEITVVATLHWADGREKRYELSAVTRSVDDQPTARLGRDLVPPVRQAILAIGIELQSRLDAEKKLAAIESTVSPRGADECF